MMLFIYLNCQRFLWKSLSLSRPPPPTITESSERSIVIKIIVLSVVIITVAMASVYNGEARTQCFLPFPLSDWLIVHPLIHPYALFLSHIHGQLLPQTFYFCSVLKIKDLILSSPAGTRISVWSTWWKHSLESFLPFSNADKMSPSLEEKSDLKLLMVTSITSELFNISHCLCCFSARTSCMVALALYFTVSIRTQFRSEDIFDWKLLYIFPDLFCGRRITAAFYTYKSHFKIPNNEYWVKTLQRGTRGQNRLFSTKQTQIV